MSPKLNKPFINKLKTCNTFIAIGVLPLCANSVMCEKQKLLFSIWALKSKYFPILKGQCNKVFIVLFCIISPPQIANCIKTAFQTLY